MSNYSTKDNYDYLATRRSMSGIKTFNFFDTKTSPDKFVSFLKEISFYKSDSNVGKLRAFRMFSILNSLATSRPNYASLEYQYSTIIKSIFKDFINSSGKYNEPEDIKKTANEIRIVLIKNLKILTKCGNVNVVFKKYSNDRMFDEKISFFINDGEDVFNGASLKMKIVATGVEFDSNTTLTVVIPLEYIKKSVNQAYRGSVSVLTQSGADVSSSQKRTVANVMSKLEDIAGHDIFNALIAAIYKESMFSTFVTDVVSACTRIIKGTSPCSSFKSIPVVQFSEFQRAVKKTGIIEMNPMILMDIFDIGDIEVNTFVKNFVKSDEHRLVYSPKYSLLRNEEDCYLDAESSVSASLAYVSKYNYAIMCLLITTPGSIKEYSRINYQNLIENNLQVCNNYSKSSMIANNKSVIISEIEKQFSLMNDVTSDIIKLKQFIMKED